MKHLSAWLVLMALSGCASTQLEVARNDVADPNAPGMPEPAAPRAFAADFEAESAAPAAEAQSAYTCPMHPEIKRSEPGKCPICGMNLVPEKKPESAGDHGAHSHGDHSHGHQH